MKTARGVGVGSYVWKSLPVLRLDCAVQLVFLHGPFLSWFCSVFCCCADPHSGPASPGPSLSSATVAQPTLAIPDGSFHVFSLDVQDSVAVVAGPVLRREVVVFRPAVLHGPAPVAGTRCSAGALCVLTMTVGGLPPFMLVDTYIQVTAEADGACAAHSGLLLWVAA
jgi:hypothetical protein